MADDDTTNEQERKNTKQVALWNAMRELQSQSNDNIACVPLRIAAGYAEDAYRELHGNKAPPGWRM